MRDNNKTSSFNSTDDKKNENKEENTKEKIKRKYTHWHLGFVGAMDLELRKTGCTYTFVPET
ncbi:MAG: hypothetical protein LBE18_09450, partial [Planctomycetaceae bacterium]|nr:hypothetical protein [Planctomycetaceae bacterium]